MRRNTELSSFGILLHQEMKRSGYTREALAAEIGVKGSFLFKAERETPLSKQRILQVASALGCEPQPLFDAADEARGKVVVITEHRPPAARKFFSMIAGREVDEATANRLIEVLKDVA